MCTTWPVRDPAYQVALCFTVGSAIWVVNAFFSLLPVIRPDSAFAGETLFGGGITAIVGTTVFELGAVLALLEAINEDRSACLGWTVEHSPLHTSHSAAALSLSPDAAEHISPTDPASSVANDPDASVTNGLQTQTRIPAVQQACRHHDNTCWSKGGDDPQSAGWVWWPCKSELRQHYLRELGFVACLIQLVGATIFWIAGFTALPGILDRMSPGLVDGVFWTPQVVGGLGFVAAGILFMLETQTRWYLPNATDLGWNTALWNLIGGIGFTLCPIFGYSSAPWAQLQASCATFWGSWAFLIGSILQWYESLAKFPVEHL